MTTSHHRHGTRLMPATAVVLLILAGLLPASGPAPGSGRNPRGPADRAATYVPGEILIGFKAETTDRQRRDIRAALGARRLRGFGRSGEHLRLGAGRTTEDAVERYREHPLVEYAEPNYLWSLDLLSDDPRLVELYGLRNTGQTGGTPGADIDVESAWDLTTGTHEVIVGVIDSGIDYNHPDLSANIWINPGEIPSNGIDDDGNGYVDDVRGWDFANDDNDPFDDVGHGTHVAGTIGAVGDNGRGVVGVGWKTRLVPLKFIAEDGFGTTVDAIAAVEYATQIGADITNNSWGGGAFSQALLDAILAASEAGVLFVASAGNFGQNTDLLPHFPSSYDSPNLVSVAATDHNDARPFFSNIGPRSVDLGAPGVSVLSTLPGGAYGFLSGTSMAAPHVAGTAALVRSLAPRIDVVELKQLILDNVDPVPSMSIITVSGGRLNAFRAVTDQDQVPPGPIEDLVASSPASNSIRLSWTATGDDGDEGVASAYDLRWATWPIGAATFPLASRSPDAPTPRSAGSTETIEIGGLDPDATYYFALQALDEWGNRGPISNVTWETTLPAPTFSSTPHAIDLELFAGQTTTRALTVRNVGLGTLDWGAVIGPADGWLEVEPREGRLAAAESEELILSIETRGLAPGHHETSIDIETNDPARPVVGHPVTLELISAPAVEVSPASIDFGEVFVTGSRTIPLQIANFGTETLTVGAVEPDDPLVSVDPASLAVPPGGSRTIDATFTPQMPGTLEGRIAILSDAPNAPVLEVPFGGSSAPPPGIRVEPLSVRESVLSGDTLDRTLRVHNDGESPLVVGLFFEPGTNPGPQISSPLINGGFETGDFTGWSATQNDLFGITPWTITEAGGGWFENSAPAEGAFDALNGFEGGAALRYDLVQVFTIPAGATRAELSYLDRIQWDDQRVPGKLARIYEATIEDLDENFLSVIVRKEILFEGSGYTDLGWQPRSVDLLPFAGQTVRLHIRELIRETLTGPAQIEFDAFRIDIEGFPEWLRVEPKRAIVPPGEFTDIDLIFDATGFVSESFDGLIRIETNVPTTPELRVPVELEIFGAPDIAIEGQQVLVESTRDYTTAAARTEHTLPISRPPGGGGTIEMIANGDFGSPNESTSLIVEGRPLGSMGNVGADCLPVSRAFDLDAGDLASLVADGLVRAEVQNSPNVDPVCVVNRHTVRLAYAAPADRLDFGAVLVGSSRELTLVVENRGSDVLEIDSIASDLVEFSPAPTSLSLMAGTSAPLAVRFTPETREEFDGTLTVSSNDLDSPIIAIGLTGAGILPPLIGVEPPAIEAQLPIGGNQARALTVSNEGDGLLEFAVDVIPEAASFVSVEPASGSLAPGGALDLDVTLDAAGLAGGVHATEIVIRGANPATLDRIVPVEILVTDAPDIAIGGQTLTLSSSLEFTATGARTVHTLRPVEPPAAGGTLKLTAIGDFGDAGEVATVSLDGIPLATVGGSGIDCAPRSGRFDIGAGDLATLMADGVIVAEVLNSDSVAEICSTNRHTLELTYDRSADPLDFGTIFVGDVFDRILVVRNVGTETLHVESIEATVPGFSSSESSLSVVPGSVHELLVRFAPTSPGIFEGRLDVTSDDPDMPVRSVGLAAVAVEPPAMRVDPATLVVGLPPGGRDRRALTVSNDGTGLLEFNAAITPAGTGFVSLETTTGSVAPGGSLDLAVDFDAAGLLGGVYSAAIDLNSNDPLTPRSSVPVTLTVVGTPDLALSAGRLEFGEVFLGESGERTLILENGGTDLLQVFSIVSDTAEFVPSTGALILGPGTMQALPVTFRPSAAGTLTGTLTLSSNDPDAAAVGIDLSGVGAEPPVIEIDPEAFDESVSAGASRTRSLSVSNTGGSPLEFHLLVRPQPPGPSPVGPSVFDCEFELLSPSPEPLSCVVGDPARRHLYAQGRRTESFYRYVAPTLSWELLSAAPLTSEEGCGAALLDGRIYTAYADDDRFGVYEIATDSWTTIPAPLGETAVIASDGETYLYQISGSVGRSIDPATGATRPIATPPFPFGPLASLRHIDGVLYGHQGEGGTLFASYDLSANRWSVLPALPDGAVLGAAIDPVGRAYFAYGPHGGAKLYRYSIDARSWASATIPFFTVEDGGMAWLPSPVSGIHFARGAGGAQIARAITPETFVGVDPFSGIVAPSESMTINVTFDATELLAGLYGAEIEISSNDTASPRIGIAARLSVSGTPELSVSADRLDFDEVFVGTSRELPLVIENFGTDRLELTSSAGDAAGFSASPTALSLAPGASQSVTVTFSPTSAGEASGTLTVTSNDPNASAVDIPLSGIGVEPPVVHVDPAGLNTTLVEETRQTRRLTLSNSGLGELQFTLEIVPADSTFVTLGAAPGRVPPSGSIELAVTFDATGLPLGAYPAEIHITTNDPFRSVVVVPSSLTVVGLPDISIAGEPVVLESTADFRWSGARTIHAMPVTVPPAGRGSFELLAEGDFGNTHEFATAVAEGLALGTVGGAGADCSVFEGLFPVAGDDLATLVQDGVIEIEVQNAQRVGDFCPSNRHTVRMLYNSSAESLDFGTVFLGSSRELALLVENLGSAVLEIGSIGIDTPEFSASATSLSLPPGSSETVTIAFAPPAPTTFNGTLSIESNDPDAPLTQALLTGVGIGVPVLNLVPSAIDVTLSEGGRSTQVLALSNSGAGPLDFSLSVTPAAATFVIPDRVGGTVPPGGSVGVAVVLDGGELAPGTYAGAIEVASNDPERLQTTVPFSLSIVSAPNISFVGERVTIESREDYSAPGALTTHVLPIAIPPAGDGRFDLIGDGDFGFSIEFAIMTAEGLVIGSIGGAGSDCVPAFGRFTIDEDVLSALVDDGVVEVEVQNSPSVDPVCPDNAHTVKLSYDARRDRLDFGSVFLGQVGSRSITVFNDGSQTLEIATIASDLADSGVTPASAILAPGESRQIVVTFAPGAAGLFEGALTLTSNDPDTPVLSLPVSGTGVEPPVVGVDPLSIVVTLFEGRQERRGLTLSNTGRSPLDYSIELQPPAGFEPSFTLFGTDGGQGNLYTIDSGTGEATFVAQMRIRAPSLAVDPTTGLMYAGQGGGTPALYTVDPATGFVSLVADTGLGFASLPGLDFDSSGSLYASVNAIDDAATGGDSLAIINKSTGVARIVGEFGDGIGTEGGPAGIEGIALDPTTGALYGASGAAPRTTAEPVLYLIDPITGIATPIGPIADSEGESVPGGVVSLQFDPDGILVGGTGQRTGNLVRIDPATGRFTFVGHAVSGSLGGLALRENPPDLSFVGVSPAAGTIAPFAEIEVDVALDPRGLAPGLFGATIAVRSNDPERPVVEIPVEMTVVGLPDIAVADERIVLESIEDFTDGGATTSHTLAVARPAGGAMLELIAEGDFGSASEVARILVDGLDFGSVGNTGSDCFPAVGAFALAASDLSGLVSDGAIDIEIANSPTVGTFCVLNRHSVRLSYDTPLEQLSLGTVFLGYERTHPLIIKNDGRAELRVTSIAVDAPEVDVGSSSVTVPPFALAEVPITYTPLAVGPLAATLAIASNDPDEPELTIEIVAEALEAPAAAVEPTSIEVALPPRGDRVRTQTLRLTNTGGSALVWTTDLFEIFGSPSVAKLWSERPKGDEADNGVGALAIERTGGPDAFGYQFADSDRPNGPVFDWIDVAESGTQIPISDDDANSGPIRVGFDFPFYGTTHDLVNVSSNGWLSFSSEKTSYSNPDSLPNAGFSIPENLIAPFWDDLDPGGAGSIHYLADGSRFIVQYSGIGRFASSAQLTFQVVLYPSGKIVFNYLSMLGALDSATIGIQNDDRTIGLLVSYNEGYVHDGLAIEIAPVAPWSTAVPVSGVVPAGGFADIEVGLSSAELDAGDYLAEVLIRSNDPVNGEIRVPVTLHAAEAQLDSFEIRPRIVNTRSRGRTIRASLQLPPAYDPREIDVSSVSLYGVLFAEHHPVEFVDENGDGIEEIVLRFDRRRFVQLLPDGGEAAVTVSGEVAGQVWFSGTTTVRVGLHGDSGLVRPARGQAAQSAGSSN